MVTFQAVFSPSFTNLSTNSETRAYTLRSRKETQFVFHPKVGQWKGVDNSLRVGKGGRKRVEESKEKRKKERGRKREGGRGGRRGNKEHIKTLVG